MRTGAHRQSSRECRVEGCDVSVGRVVVHGVLSCERVKRVSLEQSGRRRRKGGRGRTRQELWVALELDVELEADGREPARPARVLCGGC